MIDHRSVSRKHLLIEVGELQEADVSRINERTLVRLTDSSKVGTSLDGDRFVKQTRTIGGRGEGKGVLDLQLGHYDVHFQLEWREVILTCTNVSKKKNKGKDRDAEFEDSLEGKKQQVFDAGLDVKIVNDYVMNRTSHVVGKKRNTAISLQALVQGRWVVGYGFLDALTKATRKEDKNATLPVELDFDAHWPHEQDYIIEAGANEPQPRPNHYLLPRAERAEVFQGYTFVFLSQSQYNQLLPVVTAGGGKGLIFVVTLGQTKVSEVVDYIREVAGRKNDMNFKLSQQDRTSGIVVVRLNEHGRNEFAEKVDLALDQRGFEQNRLLDVILTLDTSDLRKELPEPLQSQDQADGEAPQPNPAPSQPAPNLLREIRQAPAIDDQAPPSAQARPEYEGQADEQHSGPSQSTATKRWRRAPGKSRFKGFGEFEPSQFTRAPSDSPEPSAGPSVIDPNQAEILPSMDADDTPHPSNRAGNLQHQSMRKRQAEPSEVEGKNIYDSILPGQAALKRRKFEAVNNGASAFSKSIDAVDKTAKKAKAQRVKQMDVKAELKARREAEEERRKKDEEALRQMVETDISELRHLTKVEVFELPVREHSAASRVGDNGSRSERWDPKWNGRKNFKKFRPQGQRQEISGAVSRLQRVIVTLEEVPRRGHGLGDEYWLQTSPIAGKWKDEPGKTAGGRISKRNQTQTQTHYDGGEAASSEAFQRTIRRSRELDSEAAAEQAVDAIEIAGTARDEMYLPSPAAPPQGTLNQTLVLETQQMGMKAAGKRPAIVVSQQYGEGPPVKKARQSTMVKAARSVKDREEEDDGEELKFRRRRR